MTIDSRFLEVYEAGQNEGLNNPYMENPYDYNDDLHNAFWWAEGFFDGYKSILAANSVKEENV